MRKRRFALAATFVLSLAGAAASRAFAQAPSAPVPLPPVKPAAAVTELDAQKGAFLALSEEDRKAAQDALVWAGFYNGVVDGSFGKRTLDSILAYQASVKAPPSGVLSAAQLAALKASAQKSRAAIGFQTVEDLHTGIRIGAPLKWLEKRTMTAGQTLMANRSGSVSLALFAPPESEPSLATLYAKLSAESSGRKVSYKAIKADAFFVVSGEEGGRKFYLRYAVATAGGALRGFEFAYPVAQAADLDHVALAVANAFEPFPSSSEPHRTVAGPPLELGGAPTPTPTPSPAPSEPVLTATALVVASGQAATVLTEAECKTPTVGGKTVKFVRADPASGLAVIAGEFGADATAPMRAAAAGADLVVLSLAPGSGVGRAILEASDASVTPVSPARQALVAGLSKSARGAPAFNRQGALVAFIAPLSGEPQRIDGVVLAAPHELVGADAAEGLFTWGKRIAPPGAPSLGAAEIARQMRGAIVGVFCAP